MPFATIQNNADDILLSIREIFETLDEMSVTADNMMLTASEMSEGMHQIDDSVCTPSGAVWRLYGAFAKMNLSAAALTHDIELAVNERRGQWLVSGFDQAPFEVNLGNGILTVTPLGAPKLYWVQTASRFIKPDCLYLVMAWQISGGGFATQKLNIGLELQFKLTQGSATVGVVQSRAPRFYRDTGEAFDPFQQLPLRDGIRVKARSAFFGEIKNRISTFSAALPKSPLDTGPRTLNPHTYSISRTALNLICQTLPQRRTREKLGVTLSGQDNQAIRLHRTHVSSRIVNEVASQDATAQVIDFRQGYVFVKVHKHTSDGCLWIDVDVDVWFEYSMKILNVTPNRLRTQLDWIQYNWHYHIDNCWPFCGDIASEVEEELQKEIPKYYHMSFPFADLRNEARRARALIEPYGVVIQMEVTNA